MVRFSGFEIAQMAFCIYTDKFVEGKIVQGIGIQYIRHVVLAALK